ncbi:hypothetical protein AB0I53_16470 [Saccharopolyspora sp. NPDC050389]|uniref:hypothetical protein n=1 Tax=Saccharopolyspora sp. NPDC050389 TaxID=3155516 RepID=UPI0033E4B5BA
MRGVRPPATLFDGLSDALALGGVAAADEEADLVEEGPVICIAVVVNAETQQPLGLWWGEVESMDDDGLIEWTPRVLSQELAQHSVSDATDGRRLNVVEQPKVVGFSDGAEPPLAVNPRQGVNYNPQAEAEPPADHANIEDE